MQYTIEEAIGGTDGRYRKLQGCVLRQDGSIVSIDGRDGSTRVLAGEFKVTIYDEYGDSIAESFVSKPSRAEVLERVRKDMGEDEYKVLLGK